MKTTISYFGKNSLTRRERKQLLKMHRTVRKVILLFAAFTKIIKGKLGFDQTAQDGDFLFDSQAIHAALEANTGGYFVPPFPQLSLLDTANTAFETAIGDVRNGVRGAESAKITAKMDVMKLLRKAVRYINNLCEDNQAHASEIITGALMQVINFGSKRKPDLSAKQSTNFGEAKLAALAVKVDDKYISTIFEWQMSLDGGATWITLPNTPRAKTSVTGLAINARLLFRKRTNNKFGISDWSQPVELYLR